MIANRNSPRLTRAHAAQGGVTLGPEKGELGANFSHLGMTFLVAAMMQPTGFQLHQGKVKQSQYKWWEAMKVLFGATMAGPGLEPLQLQE